jgi:predicted Zn-dependent protease
MSDLRSQPTRKVDPVPSSYGEGPRLELTRTEAMAFAERVGRLTKADAFGVTLNRTVQSVTRIADGRVMINSDGVRPFFSIRLRFGNTYGFSYVTELDDTRLSEAVRYAETMAHVAPWHREKPYHMSVERLTVPDVHLWKSATVAAMTGAQSVRATALPEMLDIVSRTPFVAAGVLGFTARSNYVVESDGPEAYYRETDVVCGVSARAKDGSSSGWAGVASRDWSTIDVVDVARRAVTVAERAINPVAFEPGRRTVILSATAWGQLMAQLCGMLNAEATDSGGTPFSSRTGGSKLGTRVADERIRLWSDPDDPMGGYMPYWGDMLDYAVQNDCKEGVPVPAMTWIDRGVLMNLAYGYNYGLREGKPYNRVPLSMHMDVVPNVAYTSVDEMIATCQEGIYVNRFSPVSVIDRMSGQTTGVTRDGCLFVKNGKIAKSVKNLRFRESPAFVLNKLIAIGAPERVVVDDTFSGGAVFPIIAPPVMARDFNFTAMSDAI